MDAQGRGAPKSRIGHTEKALLKRPLDGVSAGTATLLEKACFENVKI